MIFAQVTNILKVVTDSNTVTTIAVFQYQSEQVLAVATYHATLLC